MKFFKVTYQNYLFALLCMAFASCTGSTFLEEDPNQGIDQSETKLIFSLNMPEANGYSTDGSAYEQYINDIYVYAFDKANGSFIERVDNMTIFGNDGDNKRLAIGILEADYSNLLNGVDVVLLTNLKEKGVAAPELAPTNTKEDLYSKLSYNYNSNSDLWNFKDAVHYIPMWGTCFIDAIKPGINQANILLHRAIAKINVTLNGGKGFDHFSLREIQVCNVNRKGYCAPLDEDLTQPSIPTVTEKYASMTFSCDNNGGITDRIYIPEYKNIGMASNNQSSLKIIGTLTTALGELVEKTYTLPFKKNGTGDAFDVLRNNLYIFNITSISKDVEVEHELSYTVEKWDEISIDIPSFN